MFNDASKALLDQVEQVVRLIRSKGVGVFFITQSPKDVPGDVLGQLGQPRAARAARVHARRREGAEGGGAHLPEDDVLRHRGDADDARHRRGAGDRAVARAACRRRRSRRGSSRRRRAWARSPTTRCAPLAASAQVQQYATAVDRESAREMLGARGRRARADARRAPARPRPARRAGAAPPRPRRTEAASARSCARRWRAPSPARSRAA